MQTAHSLFQLIIYNPFHIIKFIWYRKSAGWSFEYGLALSISRLQQCFKEDFRLEKILRFHLHLFFLMKNISLFVSMNRIMLVFLFSFSIFAHFLLCRQSKLVKIDKFSLYRQFVETWTVVLQQELFIIVE